MNRSLSAFLLLLLLLLLQCGSDTPSKSQQPHFVKQIKWIGKGIWLKADTHIHSDFTDGKHNIAEVASQAKAYGCDVIAITDHSDYEDDAASKDYFSEIAMARDLNSGMLIFAGLEWNIPPYGGDEHMTVLLPNTLAEAHLSEFKERFDDYKRDVTPDYREALQWLKKVAPEAVLFHNHPSRKDSLTKMNVMQMKQWMDVNDLVVGLSGAPGHQIGGKKGIGSYSYYQQTVDRWDPAVAIVGDAWDVLLAQGKMVWAARAASDFHKTRAKNAADYWPGQFSETWIYAPDHSEKGVLKALRAGSFFAAHGHIAREVQLHVSTEGLSRAAEAGEIISVPTGTKLDVTLKLSIPDADWQGLPNRIDELEIIAVTEEGSAKVMASGSPDNGKFTTSMVVSDSGVILRARGKRLMPDEPDLLFYTNPVRVNVQLP